MYFFRGMDENGYPRIAGLGGCGRCGDRSGSEANNIKGLSFRGGNF